MELYRRVQDKADTLSAPYSNRLNSSTVRPASRTIPPIVQGVDGVRTGNRQNSPPVAHDSVLSLTHDLKSRLPQCAERDLVVDAG